MPSPWMIHDHPALGDRTLTPMEANPRADSDIIQEIVSRSVADIRANRERDKADFVNVVNKWISNGRRGKLFSGKKIKSVATWIQDEWLNNPSFVKEIGRLAGLSPEELEAVTQQGIEEARAQKPVFSIGDEEDNDPRFSLGVPYQGSKNRIAKRIIDRLPEGRRFVDLFSGGGAVTHAAMLSGKYGRYHMNDINDAGQQLFLQGVRGEWDNYDRTEMTDDEFKAIKGTPEGLVWSYNGLGRNIARPDKNGRDKAAEQIRRVKSLSSLRDKAGDIDASNVDYRGVILHPGDVVYADIPYEGTDQAGYGKGKFNKQAFVEWAQAQDVPIFVSEYTMPEGWVEVESYDVPGMKGGRRTERLWVQEKFAESMVRDDATEQEKSESQVKFSIVEDPEELERLNKGKTVPRFRAMVEIDGKLYPPMSVYADGKLREPTKEGVWERSDETPLTDEQKAAITALEEKGETGDVVIIPDKLRYHKGSKKGKSTLQFKLNKDNGDYVWAAYNPYFHTSTSGMNDQFSSAWKRPNLVVVEVEVPESELTDGYQAPYAKDAVGNTPWKSGTVNNALPPDRQRTISLSRYAKVVDKVDDAEVAKMIAKQLEGLDIEVPFNVVTPSLRDELVKHGVKIGPPEKGNTGKAAIPAYEEWLESQGGKGEQVKFSLPGEEESQGEKDEQSSSPIQDEIKRAEKETETYLSEAQKKAGNYKKGHVKIDGFDISIEQPKGSVRSGVDETGKAWSTKMNNTYGYIRGTEGADGDQIDVFLSDHMDDWNGMVFVVDQVKKDGSFDEYKVMYGFNDYDEAWNAYHSNYEKGWRGLGL